MDPKKTPQNEKTNEGKLLHKSDNLSAWKTKDSPFNN